MVCPLLDITITIREIENGLELHEQERIANKEYKQRLARKEAESVLQTVSDADES